MAKKKNLQAQRSGVLLYGRRVRGFCYFIIPSSRLVSKESPSFFCVLHVSLRFRDAGVDTGERYYGNLIGAEMTHYPDPSPDRQANQA